MSAKTFTEADAQAANVILVSGAVPGAKGGYLTIRPAKKKSA